MKYSKRDVIVGFIIILIIVLGVFLYKKYKTPKLALSPSPTTITFEKDLESSFKYDIPDDVNRIELKDVSGGNTRGIATEKEVLVDADYPEPQYFYQGWLQDGDRLISLGKLQIAKGGWLLEYDKSIYPSYKKIIISLETKNDMSVEKVILEGTFN